MRWLLQAHYRTLHNGHVQEIPPRTFCVRFLFEATEQGNVQGAKRQTLLPWMLRQAIWLVGKISTHLNQLSQFFFVSMSHSGCQRVSKEVYDASQGITTFIKID